MAMNKEVLGASIALAISGLSDDDKLDITKIWSAIGGEIITHIQTLGVVSTTVATVVQTVPTTGTGTGSGTGAGKIS